MRVRRSIVAWAIASASLGAGAREAPANDTFPIQLVAGSTVTGVTADGSQADPVSALPVQDEILLDAGIPGNHSHTTYDLSETALALDFDLQAAPDFAHEASGEDSASAALTFIAHAQVAYELTHHHLPSGIVPMVDNAQLEIDLTDTTAPLLSYHFLANDLEPPIESGPATGVLLAEHVYELAIQAHVRGALGGSGHVTASGDVTMQIAHVPEPGAPAPATLAALGLLSARRRHRRSSRSYAARRKP